MNFRGSYGYGHDFMSQGLLNWGKTMQDDIVDGLKWLKFQGLDKDDQACIVGASYGGYAALMAAARDDGHFKCAVSFAGVTDLNILVSNQMKFIGGSAVRKLLGTSRKERGLYSPVKLASRIKNPVLILHGTEDRTVTIDHGRKMNRALKRQKPKNYRYVELEDGDHHLSLQKNRILLFEEMEEFLATYLD